MILLFLQWLCRGAISGTELYFLSHSPHPLKWIYTNKINGTQKSFFYLFVIHIILEAIEALFQTELEANTVIAEIYECSYGFNLGHRLVLNCYRENFQSTQNTW